MAQIAQRQHAAPKRQRKTEAIAQRILIYRFGQLGDTVVALPALKAVRRQFPHAYVALLTADSATKRWVSIAEILPAGLVDEVMSYEAGGRGALGLSFLGLMRKLRAQRFDLVVYLVPRTRTRYAVLRDLLYFRLAGIKHVAGHIGFAPLPRKRGSRLPRVDHEAEHLLVRLQKSGIGVLESVADGLNLDLTDEELAFGRDWLRAEGIANGERRLVGLGPGSKWPSKRWPEERFAELGRRLEREIEVLPIVFGGSDERDLGDRLIRDWGMGINAAGRLRVRAAAAVLRQCDLYVGNDTGTMHLAAAVGTPCVGIFSAQDWPGRWYPYGASHAVLRTTPPCEGCRLVECVEHDIACLRAISVEAVLDACRARILRTRTTAPMSAWAA